MTLPATIAQFKAQFDRDFIFGTGYETVRDQDVSRALTEAQSLFNTGIWTSDETVYAYCYVAAHFLVMNIQAAGGLSSVRSGAGVQNKGGGIQQQKSVGQVSVAYSIPESIKESPVLNQFMRSDYGLKYLQLLTPRLVGAGYAVAGPSECDVPFGI